LSTATESLLIPAVDNEVVRPYIAAPAQQVVLAQFELEVLLL
jgi:hypothetical protein